MADGYGCKAAESSMQADGPATVKLREPCCLDLVAGMWEGLLSTNGQETLWEAQGFYENGGAQET